MVLNSTQLFSIDELASISWEKEIPYIPGNEAAIPLEMWQEIPLSQKIKLVAEFLKKNQGNGNPSSNPNCALIIDRCWKKIDECSANKETKGAEIVSAAQAIFQLPETETTKAKKTKLIIQFHNKETVQLSDPEVTALRHDFEFFEKMLGGKFKESQQPTISINGISKADFLKLMEAQYGQGPQDPNEALRLILVGHSLLFFPESCIQAVLDGISLYPTDLYSLLYLKEVYESLSLSSFHFSQKIKEALGQRLANFYLYLEEHSQELIDQLTALPVEERLLIMEDDKKEGISYEEACQRFYQSQLNKCLEFYKKLEVEKLLIRTGSNQAIQKLIESSCSLRSLIIEKTTVEDTTLDALEKHLELQELVVARCKKLTDNFFLKVAKLPKLETLNLSECKQTDHAMAEIAKAPELKSLNVSFCIQLTDVSLIPIVQAPKFEHLDARYCQISKATISACLEKNRLKSLSIAGCPQFETWIEEVSKINSLEALDASFGFNLTNQEFGWISKMSNIKHLSLSNCTTLDNESLAMITSMQGLISLDLSNCCKVTEEGIPLLIKLQNLENLNVKMCNFEDEGLIAIATYMPRLKELVLDRCPWLTEKSFKLVANMANLRSLSLVGCSRIDVETLEDVIKQLKLKTLNLGECSQVDDELLLTIAKENQALQVLVLDHLDQISDQAIQAIATLPNLTQLRVLGCLTLSDISMNSLLQSETLLELDIRSCHLISEKMVRKLSRRSELHLQHGEVKKW